MLEYPKAVDSLTTKKSTDEQWTISRKLESSRSSSTTIRNRNKLGIFKIESERSAKRRSNKPRDYVAIGRQVMAVDHLPAGAPMYYDLDPQFRALTVGARGGVDLSEIQTTRIALEPIILAVYPKVHVMDVATRRSKNNRAGVKDCYMLEQAKAENTSLSILVTTS
jgi:hypothetical protein